MSKNTEEKKKIKEVYYLYRKIVKQKPCDKKNTPRQSLTRK